MANQEHIEILKKGQETIDEFRSQNPGVVLDISNTILKDLDLSGLDLMRPCDFHGSTLDHVAFQNCSFDGTNFAEIKIINRTDFTGSKFNGASFHGGEISLAYFGSTQFMDPVFNKATISHTQFKDTIFSGRISLRNSKITHCSFQNGRILNADFHGSDLIHTDFTGADLRGVNFEEADLSNAVLVGVTVNDTIKFRNVRSVTGCRIERVTLELLNEHYGGLTEGHRRTLQIIDDVAFLRSRFGGFWQWIHGIALVTFLFPYAWFLGKEWFNAKFLIPEENSTTLLNIFVRYLISGGQVEGWRSSYQVNWFTLVPFIVFLIYNSLRGALLWKTKSLELHENITGLPPVFSLKASKWNIAYNFSRYLFWIYIIFVLVNTYLFLQIRVPI